MPVNNVFAQNSAEEIQEDENKYNAYTYKAGKIKAEYDGMEITVKYDAAAKIKEGTELKIAKLSQNSSKYESYKSKAEEKLKEKQDLKGLYTVKFVYEKETVTPKTQVSFTMKTDYKAYMFLYGNDFAINEGFSVLYNAQEKELIVALAKDVSQQTNNFKPEDVIENNIEINPGHTSSQNEPVTPVVPTEEESEPVENNQEPVEQIPDQIEEGIEETPVEPEQPQQENNPEQQEALVDGIIIPEKEEPKEPEYAYEYIFNNPDEEKQIRIFADYDS